MENTIERVWHLLEADLKVKIESSRHEITDITKIIKDELKETTNLDKSLSDILDKIEAVAKENPKNVKEKFREAFSNAMEVSALNLVVKPFGINMHSSNYSIFLSEKDFKNHLTKEADNFISCGYCWEKVFKTFAEKELPEIKDQIEYDSEAGMFCAYSSNLKAMNLFSQKLSDIYANEKELKNIIENTDFDMKIDI